MVDQTHNQSTAIVYEWCFDLDLSPSECDALTEVLSKDEVARARRFVRPELSNRWIAARGQMRKALAQLACSNPANLFFEIGAHGKPFLKAEALSGRNALCFSLSHSGNIAVLAASFDCEVGIDIEHVYPIEAETIEFALTPFELAFLEGLREEERHLTFIRFWTLKEALLKAAGYGLTKSLRSIEIDLRSGSPRLRSVDGLGAPENWSTALTARGRRIAQGLAARTKGRVLSIIDAHNWVAPPNAALLNRYQAGHRSGTPQSGQSACFEREGFALEGVKRSDSSADRSGARRRAAKAIELQECGVRAGARQADPETLSPSRSHDLVQDRTRNGRTLRMLVVFDEFTRRGCGDDRCQTGVSPVGQRPRDDDVLQCLTKTCLLQYLIKSISLAGS